MYLAKLAALALAVAAPTSTIDVSGTYKSNWGAVTLHQDGTRITGNYVYQHGHIDGVLDGNVIRYVWDESDSHGHGIFVVASDGELIGTWGVGIDDTSGGGWRLVPGTANASATATSAAIAR
jgi:hypothetical protein